MKQTTRSVFFLIGLFISSSLFSQWTTQGSGLTTANRRIVDIVAVDRNTAWAVAKDNANATPCRDFTRTTDGGATWTSGIVNTAPTNYDFSNITAIDANTAWALMYNTAAAGGGIFKTTDGGANWVQQAAGLIFNGANSFPNIIHFWNANNGIAIGDPSGGYYEIYTTNNGGTTWTRTPSINIPAPQASEYGIVDKFSVYGNTIWFPTSFGRVFKSTDAGLNWTTSAVVAANARDVDFINANNGFFTDNSGALYKTTNGGSTWSQVTPNGTFQFGDLEHIPYTTTLVSYGALGCIYSNDNGVNWGNIDNLAHYAMTWYNGSTAWAGSISTGPANGIRKYNGSTFINNIQGASSQVIGYTTYQLQTNASTGNSFVKNTDGSLSAAWNLSLTTNASFPDRGAGYNYYDGSTWQPTPTARVESVKTGFPSIAVTASGAEVLAAHEGSVGIRISRRPTKGTGAWAETNIGVLGFWPSIVAGGSDGNSIHMISHSGGNFGRLAYSRSLDGGVTWDILNSIIPQIDSTQYKGFRGDTYSIDARGNVIAIVVGGYTHDVVLLKSTDNGNTWTKTIVKQFPIQLYDETTMNTDLNTDGTGDQIPTCDETVSLLIDNSNTVNVWYGKTVVFQNPATAFVSLINSTDGIMYWKEGMASNAPVQITNFKDINGDGVLGSTTSGYYVQSVSSHPSPGIDASGNLYLAYSSLYDGKTENGSVLTGKRYRHTLLTRSTNGGSTWCSPLDVISPEDVSGAYDFTEGVFAAMAKNVDANVHLTVLRDASIGHGLGVPADTQLDTLAEVVYHKIPVTSICSNSPISVMVGTTTKTDVSCFGGSNGQITVSMVGGVAPYTYSWNTNPVQTGATASNLAPGTYVCTVTDNSGQTYTAIATITQPSSPLSVSLSKTNTNCAATDGSVTATVSGGGAPYTYSWSNGFTGANTVTNLGIGTYSVIVTDSRGCSVTSVATTIGIIPANYSLDFSASPQTGAAPLSAAFNNNTPSLSLYNFTWYYGDGSFANNNNATSFFTYNFSGLYDVTLLATNIANGCKDTLVKTGYVFATGTGCSHTATIDLAGPVQACAGDSVLLVASTSAASPYSFVWNINGIAIGGATDDSIYVTSSGYYSVTVLKNGCPKTSTATQVIFNLPPPSPQVSAAGSIQTCIGGTVTLTASTIAGVTYSWNSGQSTQTITTSTAGTYTVTVTNTVSGCSSSSAPYTVNNSTPYVPVCLVTVDTLSTHNIVVWEKPVSTQIDSFYIYREVTTGVFQQIGSVSYDSLSEYHDYGANPNSTAFSYKIAALDTCGGVGAMSDFHKTIHLQNLGSGNLQWTLYDIENASNPVTFYRVYRDDLGTGNFLPITTTIPGGNTTFTDVNYASFPNADYRVDVAWAFTCTPTRTTINTTRSNIKSSALIGINENMFNQSFVIYPNPATNSITLTSLLANERMSLLIYNAIGQVVYSKALVVGSELISTEGFPRGVYTMTIQTEKGLAYKRIVLQ
jgi:photosystem II stability/assembly factor-like uncharacterized protein